MTTPRLLLRRDLQNGLTLELYDHSRLMAGDRWQVVLEVRLAIPLTAGHLPPEMRGRLPEVIQALGPEVIFSQQDRRHFIDAREAPALLLKMQERLLQGIEGYVGHPSFAPGFLLKKFTEWRAGQGLPSG